MTPRKNHTLPLLPATPLFPTLEGLFEVTRHPARGLNPDAYVASGTTEIQGHRQVCGTRCGGPRTPLTTDANLDCAFVENTLSYTDP